MCQLRTYIITVGKDPYNLPPNTERGVDQTTFSPRAIADSDNANYRPEIDDDRQLVGARGADNQPTFRKFAREDQQTERSDATGHIPQGEVDDLLSSAPDGIKGISGRTRGAKVDAWKQDREVDRYMNDTELTDEEQDVEIGRATGRG
ncbi:uncharacterized protein PHACADRAFT_182452 [Phanerochaete carnosa HHB-10118-sp]|uniref:Uncharacterized protein n=1 Tax=Phanerochaete carnosa (strain HHB-10118-sp) TaxID=650164 RepID=K5W2H0_PHACS|nr:uncharacterized protein PHACADRAFT_182452 [Phanerochaete carnosa HHB-10118-sp]EKM58063.1 hypothetical protein PHACADRAFT_182452 [Phanerochaete carnosa HHB-10118-sp]